MLSKLMKVMYILDCEPSLRIFLHLKTKLKLRFGILVESVVDGQFCCIKKPSYRSSVSNLNMVKENQEHGAKTIRGTIEYFSKGFAKENCICRHILLPKNFT